jgi:hypothetical protein
MAFSERISSNKGGGSFSFIEEDEVGQQKLSATIDDMSPSQEGSNKSSTRRCSGRVPQASFGANQTPISMKILAMWRTSLRYVTL